MNNKLQQIKEFAQKHLGKDQCSAHSMDHVMRVFNLANTLAKGQKVDLEVIQIAALLHDIGGAQEANDKSGKTDHALVSAQMADPFLRKLGYNEEKIQHIKDCIETHRYRTTRRPKTLEAKIVFDADKLETVGAIGVARAYAWVGKHNAYLYRKVDIKKYADENLGGSLKGRIQDRSKHSPQINWETKDKHIVNYLYTPQAKKIAKARKKYFEQFLDKLEREIQGKE